MHRNDFLQLLAYEASAVVSLGFVNNHGECVHQVSVQQHVQLYQLRLLVTDEFVVQGAVASGLGFQRIKEIIDYFIQRHFVVELNSGFCDVFHVDHVAAAFLTEFHDSTYVFLRNHDVCLNNRFFDMLDQSQIRQVGRVLNHFFRAVVHDNLIYYGWGCGNNGQAEFSFQTFHDDFHV